MNGRCRVALVRHAQMTQTQQDAAEHDRLAHAEIAVGQDSANQRHGIHHAAIGTADDQPLRFQKAVMLDQIQQ